MTAAGTRGSASMQIRHLLVIAPLALAACGTTPDLPPVETAKAIHVERVRVQYAAAFAAGTADLPVAETARLESFLDQSGVRPNDRVFVAAPLNDPLAAERVRRVVTLLAQRGLGAEPIALPQAELAPNHVVVLSDRYIAMPPACPDWSASAAHDNAASANYGCATMSDLSLMIDNPRDLMRGQELGPALGDPAADSVMRYRTGTVKGLSGGSASSSASQSSSSSSSSSSSTPSDQTSAISTSPSATMLNGAAAASPSPSQ